MKTRAFLIIFLLPISIVVTHAQVNLTDTWELYRHGDPPGGGVFMTITHTGETIHAEWDIWKGNGKFNFTNNTGFYNWTFTDGRTGSTSFTYYPEYDIIQGYVNGSGLNWTFFGRRNSKLLANFTGTYSPLARSLDILVLRQTANKLDAFWTINGTHTYGTGFVIGNFSMVEFASTVSTSGKYYLFISNDGQQIWMQWYNLVPSRSSGAVKYIKEPGTTSIGPPSGWIGIDGKQSCLQDGTGGNRLSCLSSEDFEESGLCMDPRTLPLIDYWLSKAKPFRNWDGAWYDCWGRWVGTNQAGNTVVRNNCHRPDTDGMTRCEYLLTQLRDSRPNVNEDPIGNRTLINFLIRNL